MLDRWAGVIAARRGGVRPAAGAATPSATGNRSGTGNAAPADARRRGKRGGGRG
jgi:hypothetical protein